MDVNEMVTIFGNGFFPVVMCIVLCYYINTTQKSLTDAIEQLKDCMSEIKSEIARLKNENK